MLLRNRYGVLGAFITKHLTTAPVCTHQYTFHQLELFGFTTLAQECEIYFETFIIQCSCTICQQKDKSNYNK